MKCGVIIEQLDLRITKEVSNLLHIVILRNYAQNVERDEADSQGQNGQENDTKPDNSLIVGLA